MDYTYRYFESKGIRLEGKLKNITEPQVGIE